MGRMSTKVATRVSTGVKRFQPILASAKARDVNEADTATITLDMLSEVFGFDKYSEITGEHAIRGTYVDLAVKLDGKLHFLVEVKAIGQTLEERHVKQAVDYAVNQGVEWVVLTNGAQWRTYKVTYGKPVNQELVMDVDLLALNPRNQGHMESLFPLTKEGIAKSALQEHHEQRQATNRYILGAVILGEPVLEAVRREVRRLSPGVRIELEDLRDLVANEVLKREVVDGEKATEARQKVKRAAARKLRSLTPEEPQEEEKTAEPAPVPEPPAA